MPRSVWFLLSIGPIPGKPVCLKSLAMPLYLCNLSGGDRGREAKEGGDMTEKEEEGKKSL